MNTHQANRYTQFITPLGGIIALICFFFPWCTTTNNFRDESGFQFTQSGFVFSVFTPTVFIASVMIVGVGLYMVIRRTPWKSSVPVLISSGIGLAILLAKQLNHTKLNRTFDHVNSAIELGFWGTFAGLIIAALGTFLIRTEREKARSKDSVDVKQLWFIIHAGGIIALFGIFMPWKGLSSPGHSFMETGFSLMDRYPLIIFVFVASVIVLVGSFYTLVSGNLRRLRGVVLVSIGIGLGILFAYYWDFYALEIYTPEIRLRNSANEMFRRSISFGFYLTILGYVVSAFGMFCGADVLDEENNKDEQVEFSEA